MFFIKLSIQLKIVQLSLYSFLCDELSLFNSKVWHQELDRWLRSYSEENGKSLDLLILNRFAFIIFRSATPFTITKVISILPHSGLWDVTRWGPNLVSDYKDNLRKLLATVDEVVVRRGGKFIWINGLPMSRDLNSKAMANPEMEFKGEAFISFCATIIRSNLNLSM